MALSPASGLASSLSVIHANRSTLTGDRLQPRIAMNPTSHEKDPILGRAIGKIPSGVYVLTSRAGEADATAMLASWVQQAAFAPLSLSVAMAKDRPAYDVVRRAGSFVLSVLGEHDA